MPIVDVTDQVDFGWADEELLPMLKCACGATWGSLRWGPLVLGYDLDGARECPECGRKFYWTSKTTVWEVTR